MIDTAIEGRDAVRWLASAVLVFGLHAATVALLVQWKIPVEIGDGDAIVLVDLAPISATLPEATPEDIAPGPRQQADDAAEPRPENRDEKTEPKPEEKVEPPPPAPSPEVVVPLDVPKVEETDRRPATPPAPIATAPPPPRPSAGRIASWHRAIVQQLERHKGYPEAARSHHQTGVVRLGFSIDRGGHVVASRVIESSGVTALDQETLATVRRAEPFPPPPPDMPGQKFEFAVPIRFNIR